LWHLPVFVVVYGWAKGRGYGWGSLIAMSTGAALLVGVGFAEIVEIPALALRERLFPNRSRPDD
jgi:peptidoglycan/LPS O-acetylase OafA/YrhL